MNATKGDSTLGRNKTWRLLSGTGSMYILRHLAALSRFVTFCRGYFTVAARFATLCHGAHGKLGCMVVVLSRSIRARPGVLRFVGTACYGTARYCALRSTMV